MDVVELKLQECECPRGNWICSHMAAVAIHVNKRGMSKTDLPNSWISHPKNADKENIRPLSEVFPPPKPAYTALRRKPNDSDRKFLSDELLRANFDCPMSWIVSPKLNPCSAISVAIIEEILPDFVNDKNVFIQKCKVTRNQISVVANQTKLQRACHTWGKLRKLRLTGSNFGIVLRAYNRNEVSGKSYPPSLFKQLRGEYDLSGKDSILWGQMHERAAIEAYESATGNIVHHVGLVLFECGFLGCSPDGIITDQHGTKLGVLEVKCPWKYRNYTVEDMTAQELKGRKESNSFFLTSEGELNPTHNYWHQVQAEIAALGVEWCHFVVWTTKGVKVVHVKREESWQSTNLPKLKKFYLNEFLPKVVTDNKDKHTTAN